LSAHVTLITPEALNSQHRLAWFSCVQDHTPDGLITATEIPSHSGKKNSTYYVKRTTNQKHAHVIPLVRDLQPHEVHEILKAWCEKYPEGDFLMDYSQPDSHVSTQDKLQTDRWDQILDTWGKQQHGAWMARKQQEGWRYGMRMSLADKTHPWMQPWESLPAQARSLNAQGAKDLMHILKQFGYQISQTPRG
jgi:hypothetical protein